MPTTPQPPDNYSRTCIKWDGGWMELDGALRQSLEHDGEITEHPVDVGANVADHYRPFNVPIIIDAVITNSPLSLPRTHTGGAQQIQDYIEISIAKPIFPGAPTSLALGVGSVDIRNHSTISVPVVNYDPELDRINEIYQELEAIRLEPRLLSVSLGLIKNPQGGAYFDNLLLKRFSVDREAGENSGSIALALEFHRINFADVATTTVEISKPKKSRSKPKKPKGKQAAPEAPFEKSQSFAKRLGLLG